MTIQSSIAFVLTMMLFVASPGPGVMGCVAVALRRSLKNSAAFIAGMIMGDIVYLIFAVFGLTAIAQNFGTIFHIIRVLGGFYLLYLAYKLWTSRPLGEIDEKPSRGRNNLIAGFFITISNPKVIIFYCGFLPNFMNLAALGTKDILIVSCLVAFVISLVMGSYSYLAARTGHVLSKRSGRLINRSAGAVLATAGTMLILKK